MGSGIHGVNHVASLAKNMEETVHFYKEFLDIEIKRIASDTPEHKHYCLDLGGGGTLDFFEAKPGTASSERGSIGALNHLAITAEPAFIAATPSYWPITPIFFMSLRRPLIVVDLP